MTKTPKVDSKEVGLVAGLNLFKYFLGTTDLHYGLWSDDLEVTIGNLPEAQKRYSDYLISNIPGDVKRILDVGCGAGGLASKLLGHGYQVDGVSPSQLLSEAAQKYAGDDLTIYPGRFEDVDIPANQQYDMVVFSESFQYITLDLVLEKAKMLLRPGGYILICDFFRTNAKGKSPLGGGHRLDSFFEVLNASGLKTLKEEDITNQTAPNLDIVDHMGRELIMPTMNLIGYTFKSNRPWLSKIFVWKFRKKLDKLHYKYLSGERNAESFAKYKIYKLFLLQKQS
jgi:SAM-dependent methyltransferase